jgi:MFS transporter, ACS family, allantoate permease
LPALQGNIMTKKTPLENPRSSEINPQPLGTVDIEEAEMKVLGADPALKFTSEETVTYTAEEEAKVLTKIDWHILPMLCWIYAIQFADKTTLNYASLMGIRTATHLDSNSQQYSWVSSIFYAGYIMWEWVHHNSFALGSC